MPKFIYRLFQLDPTEYANLDSLEEMGIIMISTKPKYAERILGCKYPGVMLNASKKYMVSLTDVEQAKKLKTTNMLRRWRRHFQNKMSNRRKREQRKKGDDKEAEKRDQREKEDDSNSPFARSMISAGTPKSRTPRSHFENFSEISKSEASSFFDESQFYTTAPTHFFSEISDDEADAKEEASKHFGHKVRRIFSLQECYGRQKKASE